MTRRRWMGSILAIVAFLVASGIALAVTFYQASDGVPAAVSVHSTVVISGDNLGLWHDPAGTQPIASLGYIGRKLPPPLRDSVPAEATVYIENRSIYTMTLVEPCGPVENPAGTTIGHINADLFDIATGRHLGDVCEALDGTAIASGKLVRASIRISLEPSITLGDHAFTTVFGALGVDPRVQPPPGMVSWWPGDGNANDIVGDNDGTLMGGATFAPGMVGQAFSFDGVDDYVNTGVNNLPDSTQGTVVMWVKPDIAEAREHVPISFGTEIARRLTINIDTRPGSPDGRIAAKIGSSFTPPAVVTSAWSNGVWVLVAAVWQADTMSLYVNGVLMDQNNAAVQPMSNPTVSNIGQFAFQSGEEFSGLIDELAIFNRALSDDEIKAIFDTGSAGKKKP